MKNKFISRLTKPSILGVRNFLVRVRNCIKIGNSTHIESIGLIERQTFYFFGGKGKISYPPPIGRQSETNSSQILGY